MPTSLQTVEDGQTSPATLRLADAVVLQDALNPPGNTEGLAMELAHGVFQQGEEPDFFLAATIGARATATRVDVHLPLSPGC
jgi:hypothetical protein